MPTLERSNPVPLYYQLKQVLKEQIQAGHLEPHTAIPSEPELVSRYHVSRATVRQALTELVHEGLLYRLHGKGTFVSEPRVQQQTLSELTSFTEEMQRRNKRPGGMLIISELVRGSDEVRSKLQLTDTEQAIRLERLRTADGILVAHEIVYLPYPRAAAVYTRAKEAATGSLYVLMTSEGLKPHTVEQKLRADLPTVRETEMLTLSQNEPGLRLTCSVFDQTGTPIAYSDTFFVGTRYEFHVTLRSKS
jgi:GntR family transcriptional regulator